jgi:hypothetical protein
LDKSAGMSSNLFVLVQPYPVFHKQIMQELQQQQQQQQQQKSSEKMCQFHHDPQQNNKSQPTLEIKFICCVCA